MSLPERVWNERGGYHFLPAIRAFSSGVVADDEHELVRVRTHRPVSALPELLQEVLRGRAPATLCAMELRTGQPFSWSGFAAFNDRYAEMLDELGVTVDGVNPVARTNVVPVLDPPAEPTIHALTVTVPRSGRRPTFVVAGAADVAGNSAAGVVRPGESGPEALREKAEFVLARMVERLGALGVEPDELATPHVYTVHPLDPELCAAVGSAVGDREGSFRLHPSRPPIEGLEFEMDVRSVALELTA